MERIPVRVRRKAFEIQVGEGTVKFFHVKSRHEFVQLGSVSYAISADGEVLNVSSGSFTFDPENLGLGTSDVGRLERLFLGEAEMAIARSHPGVNKVIGMVYDHARGIGIDAGRLIRLHGRKREIPGRIRFGAGRHHRRRPG